MSLIDTQPGLVVVAQEKWAGQLNVMPSQGQTAWPGAEHWCEAEPELHAQTLWHDTDTT